MKNLHRHLALALVLSLSILGLLVASPASGIIGVATVTTPPLGSTTTTALNTVSTTTSTTTTTTSTSTSTTATSTSTTTTSTSTSFSFTTTVSSSTTSTQTLTSYTSTQVFQATSFTSVPSTVVQVTTSTTTNTVRGLFPTCPVAFAVAGTSLEPYANLLRGFRDNQIENTTAGRVFMQAFNGWYYSWAPSVSYTAAANPWFLQALRAGVYPLIGILYASYLSYQVVSPLSSEAGAIAAGMVAASLIGLVYVAPAAYISLRLIRRHSRLFILKGMHATPAAAWVAASALMIGAAYLSGSALVMGLATASLTLSMLSMASILGALGLKSIQMPTTLPTLMWAVRHRNRQLP